MIESTISDATEDTVVLDDHQTYNSVSDTEDINDKDDNNNDNENDDNHHLQVTDKTTTTIRNNYAAGPVQRFPDDAKLGSKCNCWSEPPHGQYNIRGANYLNDHKKVTSGPFLFPARGVDLLLIDECPENVGQNTKLFGGCLRDVPTFIVNFRMPWGVLLFYYEIPNRFLPYLHARYNNNNNPKDHHYQTLVNQIQSMTPADRTVCRFLLGNDDHKNSTFKLIPGVAQGPWVVKSTIPHKPAIIGNKLPTKYFYSPGHEDNNNNGNRTAPYLEVDLDITANATARGLLHVVKTYTKVLTVDLGFTIQGNSEDE